jgi:hypothetical protein
MTCDTHGRGEKSVQCFGGKARRKDTTGKTKAWVGRWDQNESWGDWLGGCGLDSTNSGQGTVAGCCECGDGCVDSCATELVADSKTRN